MVFCYQNTLQAKIVPAKVKQGLTENLQVVRKAWLLA